MIPASMPLGPFVVCAGGKLTFRAPDTEAGFSFLWHGRCFAIRLAGGQMHCAVSVGRVPSTSAGAGRREAAMPMLRRLGPLLPGGWHLRLLPDHRIQLDAMQDQEWPATAAALMTPIIGLVLQAAPVLDLLEEAGLG
jgi:hypothetical protein